jgi:hypothetical protein
MHWLLVGYMFLFIDRPFEVWPALGDWHVERAYMIVCLLAWFVYPNKRWMANPLHLSFAGLAVAILLSWGMSPWSAAGQPRVEDWFKILVFYGLLITTVHDERGLKTIVVGFLTVMALYLLHSFKEYLGGRHTYRMGIARMIGVDETLGDPNSFGASIVYTLPFVAAFWKAKLFGKWGKAALGSYFLLSVLCILLTGSRSSFVGLGVWCIGMVMMTRRRWLMIPALFAAAPMAFVALPESLQTRFETIINPDAGPANAKTSGEGRIEGLIKGFELWGQFPLTGAGPGAWRPATKSTIESHSLPGQLVGETGAIGLIAFVAMLGAFAWNLYRIRVLTKQNPQWENDFTVLTAKAVGIGVLLLLFMGLFGHNLFRYSWLWYGGFLVVARSCLERREWDWDGHEEQEAVIQSYRYTWPAKEEPVELEWAEGRAVFAKRELANTAN